MEKFLVLKFVKLGILLYHTHCQNNVLVKKFSTYMEPCMHSPEDLKVRFFFAK